MKGLAATFSTLTLLAIPAQAYAKADSDWTGPYGGIQGTVVGEHSTWDGDINYVTNDGGEGEVSEAAVVNNTVPVHFKESRTVDGGGARLGYNYQTGSSVFGVEGDVNFFSLTHVVDAASSSDSAAPTYEARTHASVLGTVRARLGVAFDRVLLFGTGGVAFTNLRHSFALSNGLYDEHRKSTGWTAGGGAEARLSDHLSIAATVLYVGMGTTHLHDDDGTNSFDVNVRTHYVLGSMGLNVHF